MKQEFYPTDMEDHVRIDKYLAEACPDLSRSYIQKLLKSGQVLVNGQGVKVSYIVEEDDRIELEVPEAVEPEILAEPMDLDVLYEDEDIILINKPKGMVVHPAAGHYTHTLVNGLAIVSGIICDGAKPSCAGKIAAAVDAGIMGYYMYINGQQFKGGDGIVSKGVENTITTRYATTPT